MHTIQKKHGMWMPSKRGPSLWLPTLFGVGLIGLLLYSCSGITWQPPAQGTNRCDPAQNQSLATQSEWQSFAKEDSTPACLQIAWGDALTSLTGARSTLVRLTPQGELRPYDPNTGTTTSLGLPVDSKGKGYRTTLFIFSPDHKDGGGNKLGICQNAMANVNYNCFANDQQGICAFYMRFKPTSNQQPTTPFAIDNDLNIQCKPFFRETTPTEGKPEPQNDGGPNDTTTDQSKPDTTKPDKPKPDQTPCTSPGCLWLQSGGGRDEDLGLAVAVGSDGRIFVGGVITGQDIDFPGAPKITGGANGELFIASFTKDGTFESIQTPNTPGNEDWRSAILDVAISQDGTYLYAVGTFSGNLKINNKEMGKHKPGPVNRTSGILLQLDLSSGKTPKLLKGWKIGGDGHDALTGVTTDSKGNIIVTGIVQRDPTEPDPQKARELSVEATDKKGQRFQFKNTGDMAQFACKIPSGADDASWCTFFAHATRTTTQLKAQLLPQAPIADQPTPKIATDDKDVIHIAGQYSGQNIDFGSNNASAKGPQDMYIIQLNNSSGNIEKLLTAGSPHRDGLRGIATNKQVPNLLYIAGFCQGILSTTSKLNGCKDAGQDSPRVFLAAINTKSYTWSQSASLEGTNPSVAYSINADTSGNVYVAGYFVNQFKSKNAKPTPRTPFSGNAGFVAQWNASFALQWAHIGGSNTSSTSNAATDVHIGPNDVVAFTGILDPNTSWAPANNKNKQHYGAQDVLIGIVPTSGP